jgi:S1-C subfamily serine protease
MARLRQRADPPSEMQTPRSILPVALMSAILGGGVVAALVGVLDLGHTSTTTTVVQQSPLATADASQKSGGVLTARDIYKRDAPGVAFITAQIVQRTASPFDFGAPQVQQGTSTGSGFVLDKSGTIATNAHVVDGATKVTVQFADKGPVPARILGVDKSSDIALLKVDPKQADLHPLALGSSRNIQVGDPTIAIGNPFGLDRTLTTGVVSALQRQIKAPNGFTIDNVIQTDAAINPGNSGGPLLDATGRVIGINSQIETGGSGGGNVGIGFAIPIDTVKQRISQLKSKGGVQYAYLGVTTTPIDPSMKALSLPVDHGVLVQTVEPGGPAAKAGIKGGDVSAQVGGNNLVLGGDILTKVDGKDITGADGLQAMVGRHKVGDKVKVELIREGKAKTVTVTLGNRPASISANGQGGPQLP